MATNIEMFAGDTKRIIVTVKDGDGDILNLTNPLAIKFQMVQAPQGRANYSATPVVWKDIDSNGEGIDTDDLISGIIRVTLFPSDTKYLKGQYYYELEYTDQEGAVSTVVNGIINIRESIVA
jgi:hypothetical protein